MIAADAKQLSHGHRNESSLRVLGRERENKRAARTAATTVEKAPLRCDDKKKNIPEFPTQGRIGGVAGHEFRYRGKLMSTTGSGSLVVK